MGRRFHVTFSGEAVIDLDDAVFSQVDEPWREVFYDLNSAEDIAGHIAYNKVVNRIGLSSMDGFADLSNSMARVIGYPTWQVDEVTEVTDGPSSQ